MTMSGHVVHAAVIVFIELALMMLFVFRQVHITDTTLLKAEGVGQAFDAYCQFIEWNLFLHIWIMCCRWHRVGFSTMTRIILHLMPVNNRSITCKHFPLLHDCAARRSVSTWTV